MSATLGRISHFSERNCLDNWLHDHTLSLLHPLPPSLLVPASALRHSDLGLFWFGTVLIWDCSDLGLFWFGTVLIWVCSDVRMSACSYGVVLWEILTHDKPYNEQDDENDVIRGIKNGERLPLPPGQELYELKRITEDCWSKEAKSRPLFPEILGRLNMARWSYSFTHLSFSTGIAMAVVKLVLARLCRQSRYCFASSTQLKVVSESYVALAVGRQFVHFFKVWSFYRTSLNATHAYEHNVEGCWYP